MELFFVKEYKNKSLLVQEQNEDGNIEILYLNDDYLIKKF